MKRFLVDGQHLIRAAAILLGSVLLFLVVRSFLVPAGFGELGHYRRAALEEATALPVHFAGRAACEDCHTDVVDARHGSLHERISCESCHGALAAHAEDPTSLIPSLPDAKTICLGCHRAQVTRPAAFPQIDPKEHGGDVECSECHQPHHPEAN